MPKKSFLNLATKLSFQHRAIVNVTAVDPAQNVWTTVATLTNACIYQISIKNNAVAETLECRITVDGIAVTASQAFGATENREIQFYMVPNGTLTAVFAAHNAVTAIGGYLNSPLLCRSATVEMRKTTAAGAVTINGYVFYASR